MRKLIPLLIAMIASFASPLSSYAKPVIKSAVPKSQPVTAPGPIGYLAGTLLDAGSKSPLVFILPGSGPTDRDGNNPQGVSAASYRLLAEALAAKGISTLRTDKRGLFGSAAAITDANAVTIADYVADIYSWAETMQPRQKRPCIWLLGHSEGGLITLAAAQNKSGICGVMLITAPGRKLDDVIREQLKSNPANTVILPDAMRALDELGAGRKVDVSAMHSALKSLFNPAVQPFLIDMFRHDPAKLASTIAVPMLIIGGGRDIQVSLADAEALAKAQPNAEKIIIDNMSHTLKSVSTGDRAANMATYSNPSIPIHIELVKAVESFVKAGRK
jgi:uncharacterized protein